MIVHRALLTGALLILAGPHALPAADDETGTDFFEKKIRPVLVNKCYKCHAAQSKEPRGGLLLDTREGIRRGGESGHGIVPGNLDESVIVGALRYETFEMPPDEQLPESVIADFEKWIRMGAPDPREGKSAPIRREIDFERAREFWSFQPIDDPDPPKVKDADWTRDAIDQFILDRLESRDLTPVDDADPVVLARRISFDLTGLPPSPGDVAEFEKSYAKDADQAIRSYVDRLLGTPQFGERWGRHWMDVVRYAESTGMERNATYPHAWRYRDYVIAAFNSDKPFNEFLTEQIAGDLLPHDSQAERDEHLIATGMLAMGPKSLNDTNAEKFQMDVVDEQIDVTTRAFLGLTASCARCHDHKFDPVPQTEYYALAGIFTSTDTLYGTGKQNGNRQPGKLLAIAGDSVQPVAIQGGGKRKGSAKKFENQLKSLERRLASTRKQVSAAKTDKARVAAEKRVETTERQIRKVKKQLREVTAPKSADGENAVLVMAVAESDEPGDTKLRIRGEPNERGSTISRGFLTIATLGEAHGVSENSSGRLDYASWLTGRDNPLTARVAVNRIWQHLFGRGIVRTVNNFGANGERPTHPELLDHLATSFVRDGWSTKSLIRRIMLSRVYRMSSADDDDGLAKDADNSLFWRMNLRRLEGEAIRDAILAASGSLDLEPGEKSAVAAIGDAMVGRSVQPDRFVSTSRKRSVYLPIVRGYVPELLKVFDFPEPSIIGGQRDVTTVSTQALYMMNSEFVIEQSRLLAERLLDQTMDDAERVQLAYRLSLSREPADDEIRLALQFVKQSAEQLADADRQSREATVTAWAGLCQTLFASSEFRYLN